MYAELTVAIDGSMIEYCITSQADARHYGEYWKRYDNKPVEVIIRNHNHAMPEGDDWSTFTCDCKTEEL